MVQAKNTPPVPKRVVYFASWLSSGYGGSLSTACVVVYTRRQVWHQGSSQAQIFEQVEALALSVVDGFNACICCYGQTGSGKTFTMTGLPREKKPGISFQTMDKIFEMLELRSNEAKANLEAQKRVSLLLQ